MHEPSAANVSTSSTLESNSFPLFSPSSFASYPPKFVHSLAHVLTIKEPTNYSQDIVNEFIRPNLNRMVALIGLRLI